MKEHFQKDEIDYRTDELLLTFPEKCQPCPGILSGCSLAAIHSVIVDSDEPNLVRLRQKTVGCDGAVSIKNSTYGYICAHDEPTTD